VANIKKKQHYVFRAYLRPWCEDERIYCLRDRKVFRSNLSGVACEGLFYRLEALEEREVQLIEKALIEHTNEPLKTLLRNFVSFYSFAPKLRRAWRDGADPRAMSLLDNLIANGGEDYHQKIEDHLLVFLQHMLAGHTDFFSDDEQAAQFLYAMCAQFTRTKRAREAAVARIGPTFHGSDVRRVMNVLSHLMAMTLGSSLFADRKRFKLVLLDNNTDIPLITADQPVINVHADGTVDPPQRIEFFYPLSPRKAMLLLEKDNTEPQLTNVAVNHYNVIMAQHSYEQVFSNSETYLYGIRGALCPRVV
jgi:hypothetical protein